MDEMATNHRGFYFNGPVMRQSYLQYPPSQPSYPQPPHPQYPPSQPSYTQPPHPQYPPSQPSYPQPSYPQPSYPQPPQPPQPLYSHSHSHSQPSSPSHKLYILIITTHGGYNVKKNTTTRVNSNTPISYRFKTENSPINFNHILAAPPGSVNYTCDSELSRTFERDVDNIINDLARTYTISKKVSIETAARILKEGNGYTPNSFVPTQTSSNKTFMHSVDRRFMPYYVNESETFIDKAYSYNKEEFNTKTSVYDFGIHLYEYDFVKGEKIDKTELMEKMIYELTTDGYTYFTLYNILLQLTDLESPDETDSILRDYIIIDLGCSGVNLTNESGESIRINPRDILGIKNAFNEYHEQKYVRTRLTLPSHMRKGARHMRKGGKVKYNHKNKTKKGRKSKNKNKRKSKKRKSNNNKRKSNNNKRKIKK